MWARSQDSVHKPQFLKKKESRRGPNRGPSAYQPRALPLGHTGSLYNDGQAGSLAPSGHFSVVCDYDKSWTESVTTVTRVTLAVVSLYMVKQLPKGRRTGEMTQTTRMAASRFLELAVMVCGGFFLTCEDFGRIFDDSSPACGFLLFFLGGD